MFFTRGWFVHSRADCCVQRRQEEGLLHPLASRVVRGRWGVTAAPGGRPKWKQGTVLFSDPGPLQQGPGGAQLSVSWQVWKSTFTW